MHPCRVPDFRQKPSYLRHNDVCPLDAESISSDAWAWSANQMQRMILVTTRETRNTKQITLEAHHHDICI